MWLVTEEGDITIYAVDGERPTSRFGEFTFPTFDTCPSNKQRAPAQC